MDLASEAPPNYSPNGVLDLLYAGKNLLGTGRRHKRETSCIIMKYNF